jgi:hypothetical protein
MLHRIARLVAAAHATARKHAPRVRLAVEPLEDRTVPSSFTAANVAQLIAAINAANATPEADTITLAAGKTFTLTEVNNTAHGPTGTPVIAPAGGGLTVFGNGDVIQRKATTATPAFRLFDVAANASLTLKDVTLQKGLAAVAYLAPSFIVPDPASGKGGAVYNQGALTLEGVTIENNTAQGSVAGWLPGLDAYGGGVYSGGSLTMIGSAVQNNTAEGAKGGGSARGGGLAIAGGTVTISGNSSVAGNTALGVLDGAGAGGAIWVGDGTIAVSDSSITGNTAEGGRTRPGYVSGGVGGGLWVGSTGTVTLRRVSITGNTATGGRGIGKGIGGGIYCVSVSLDADTLAHLTGNTASTRDNDLSGAYTLI